MHQWMPALADDHHLALTPALLGMDGVFLFFRVHANPTWLFCISEQNLQLQRRMKFVVVTGCRARMLSMQKIAPHLVDEALVGLGLQFIVISSVHN